MLNSDLSATKSLQAGLLAACFCDYLLQALVVAMQPEELGRSGIEVADRFLDHGGAEHGMEVLGLGVGLGADPADYLHDQCD